jgi:hypothetical protein
MDLDALNRQKVIYPVFEMNMYGRFQVMSCMENLC